MAQSFQHRRKRQRPTRVSLTYDVETGGALEKKELPFVMGVMSDLSGDGIDELDEVEKRKFTEINPDNFDKVLKGMKPKLSYTVANKLEPDSEDKIGIELNFEKFDDFSPEAIVEQVEPLKQLLDKRRDLGDLKAKLAGNRNLTKELQKALDDDDKKAQLKEDIAAAGSEDDG